MTGITRFQILQPAGSSPQNRGQHLGANWFLQPGRPSPADPALPLHTVLSKLERFQDPLGCSFSSCLARGLPLALPACWGVEGGPQGHREEGRGSKPGRNQNKPFPAWESLSPPSQKPSGGSQRDLSKHPNLIVLLLSSMLPRVPFSHLHPCRDPPSQPDRFLHPGASPAHACHSHRQPSLHT